MTSNLILSYQQTGFNTKSELNRILIQDIISKYRRVKNYNSFHQANLAFRTLSEIIEYNEKHT